MMAKDVRLQARPSPVAMLAMVAICFGALIRIAHAMSPETPLGDGGLFLAMSRDITENGWVPPAFTSYNGGEIPFAYPPLGLYVTAAASVALDPDPLLRSVPVAFSLVTIPAFFLLARELLRDAGGSWVATALYALMPASFEWLIVGGGIPRSLGVTFTILALWQVTRLATGAGWYPTVWASIFAGLALLSHPETGPAIAVGSVLIGLARAPNRGQTILRLAGVAFLAVGIAAVWWVPVLATHGLAPFQAAAGSRTGSIASVARMLTLTFSGASLANVFAGLGAIAVFVELSQRRWLFPAWVFLGAIATAGGSAALAVIPWALAIGSAMGHTLRMTGTRLEHQIVLASVLGAAVIASGLAPHAPSSPLSAYRIGVRVAADWAREESAPNSRWAVISPSDSFRDWAAEWFPTLADRTVVNVAQGYEWVGTVGERRQASPLLLDCSSSECVARWAADRDVDYLVLTDCCELLRHLADEAEFEQVDVGEADVRVYATSSTLVLPSILRDDS